MNILDRCLQPPAVPLEGRGLVEGGGELYPNRWMRSVLLAGSSVTTASTVVGAAMRTLRTQLCRAGFAIRREQRIPPNGLRALHLDNGRKQRLIEQNVPRILQGFFSEFAAMQETRGVYTQCCRSSSNR